MAVAGMISTIWLIWLCFAAIRVSGVDDDPNDWIIPRNQDPYRHWRKAFTYTEACDIPEKSDILDAAFEKMQKMVSSSPIAANLPLRS